MLGISYREHKTNEYVSQQVSNLAGLQELLLSAVECRKLSWFGHVCRHDTAPKIILQSSVDGSRQSGSICRDTPERRLGVTGFD